LPAFILVGLIYRFVDGALGRGSGVTPISILMIFGTAPAIVNIRELILLKSAPIISSK